MRIDHRQRRRLSVASASCLRFGWLTQPMPSTTNSAEICQLSRPRNHQSPQPCTPRATTTTKRKNNTKILVESSKSRVWDFPLIRARNKRSLGLFLKAMRSARDNPGKNLDPSFGFFCSSNGSDCFGSARDSDQLICHGRCRCGDSVTCHVVVCRIDI